MVYDVAVVGLGAIGSACAFELAREGQRVVGFDRFTPPHALGSSHGETRVIREAYFEDPVYVPLVQRAYDLWRELERHTGRSLLVQTGGLMLGREDSNVVSGAAASATEFKLPHEMLVAPDIRRRFPSFRIPDDFVGVFEPRAGILFPESCIESYLTLASRKGATLHFEEPLVEWAPTGDSVTLITKRGRYTAGRVVFCGGPWISSLVNLPLTINVERNVLHWFRPLSGADLFQVGSFPVFLLEDNDGLLYGLPEIPHAGAGIKIARHHSGEIASADNVNRTVSDREAQDIGSWAARYLPDLTNGWTRASVCLYTNTSDGHFFIDRHPATPHAWIVSPCSGHGFKFASVIGELIADLVVRGETRFDIRRFNANNRC